MSENAERWLERHPTFAELSPEAKEIVTRQARDLAKARKVTLKEAKALIMEGVRTYTSAPTHGAGH